MATHARHQPYGRRADSDVPPPADWADDGADDAYQQQAAWWSSPTHAQGGGPAGHPNSHAAAWYAYYGHAGARASGGDLGTVGSAELAGVDLGDKAARVCRHYARGRCTWGDGCRFSHDMEAAPVLFDGARPGTGSGSGDEDPTGSEGSPASPGSSGVPGGSSAAAVRAAYGAYVAEQQQLLMAQRHAVLDAALQAKFQIRAIATPARAAAAGAAPQRGQVILTSLANAPDIVVTLLSDDEVADALAKLAHDDVRVAAGGPLFLVGEASVFWGAMRRWHVSGSTGSAALDDEIARMLESSATNGKDSQNGDTSPKAPHIVQPRAVPCMFERLPTSYVGSEGCAARDRCPFAHRIPAEPAAAAK